jgi:ribonuclease HII
VGGTSTDGRTDGRTDGPRDDRDAPVSALERHAWAQGRAVVGIDEVGRGALAGPVTVAAVVLDPSRLPAGARDSKRLSPARREQVAATVHACSRVGLGRAENDEVDDVGLAAALTAAVRRAFAAVMALPDAPTDPLVLVDGPHDLLRSAGVEVATLVRGDAAAVSIAAASVVAKVDRDRWMAEMDPEHPAYGFARNRGYASAEHLAALTRLGPCALHRRSWAPVARLRQPTLDVRSDA